MLCWVSWPQLRLFTGVLIYETLAALVVGSHGHGGRGAAGFRVSGKGGIVNNGFQ